MIAQEQHADAMAILLSKSKELIERTKYSINKQLKNLPRKKIARASLKKMDF